jgi:hypothetical protein
MLPDVDDACCPLQHISNACTFDLHWMATIQKHNNFGHEQITDNNVSIRCLLIAAVRGETKWQRRKSNEAIELVDMTISMEIPLLPNQV